MPNRASGRVFMRDVAGGRGSQDLHVSMEAPFGGGGCCANAPLTRAPDSLTPR